MFFARIRCATSALVAPAAATTGSEIITSDARTDTLPRRHDPPILARRDFPRQPQDLLANRMPLSEQAQERPAPQQEQRQRPRGAAHPVEPLGKDQRRI